MSQPTGRTIMTQTDNLPEPDVKKNTTQD